MEGIKEHKDYLIGFLLTCLVGATLLALGPNTIDLPLLVYIPLTTVAAILLCAIVGGLVLVVSWIFTKTFTLRRFIKFSTVTGVLWTLAVILSMLKNMN